MVKDIWNGLRPCRCKSAGGGSSLLSNGAVGPEDEAKIEVRSGKLFVIDKFYLLGGYVLRWGAGIYRHRLHGVVLLIMMYVNKTGVP